MAWRSFVMLSHTRLFFSWQCFLRWLRQWVHLSSFARFSCSDSDKVPNSQSRECQPNRAYMRFSLLQLCVLVFGFLQDRDVWVGVFPESKEVFISSKRTNPGSIGICALRSFRLQRVRTRHTQMS